jgi:diketogulonate reductase-like aldo/keto reductase
MHALAVKGLKVPALGLGTFQSEGNSCYRAVTEALAIGYRHIDTAQMYGNEAEVGRAIKESGVPRDEIFLTTKIWRDNIAHDALIAGTDASLARLGLDYIDLLLIHWPNPAVPLAESLDALMEVQAARKARAIGVSNFNTTQLAQSIAYTGGKIITDQVEYHPYLNQDKILATLRKEGLFLTAYCPLARGDVADDAVLHKIAVDHGKTPAQVALRWLIQQGDVCAIPKTTQPERLRENFAVFDFDLTPGEMADIDLLKGNKRLILPNAGHWDAAA